MQGLVCPVTRVPLNRVGNWMARPDGAFYPVQHDIPILLGPEISGAVAPARTGHYAEAYAERAFYDAEAEALLARIRQHGLASYISDDIRVLNALRAHAPAFPAEEWLCARVDAPIEWDCYRHIGAITGQRAVQIGGTGTAAIAFMLAGAASATLVTPMLYEALLTHELARLYDVAVQCVVGIAEEIPLPSASADVIYSGGCVHHMTTSMAFPEVSRVLAPGGRFAALEPWRAPLYGIGTRLLGKREANPYCRPLTPERMAPLFTAFTDARYVQHGTFTRYPLLAMEKFGARVPLRVARTLGEWDDRLCSIFGMRRFGSGVAILASKH